MPPRSGIRRSAPTGTRGRRWTGWGGRSGRCGRFRCRIPRARNAANWTVYTYDGIGRTLSVKQPDGASTTTYAYAGNQITVTDPAGKWKTFTSDVLGNLTTVV